MNAEALDAILWSLPLPTVACGLAWSRGRLDAMGIARAVGVALAWTQVGAMALLATGTLTSITIGAWWVLGGAWVIAGALRRSAPPPPGGGRTEAPPPEPAWDSPSPSGRRWRRNRRRMRAPAGPWIAWALVAAVIVGLLGMAAVPPWYRDEMVYHLALPQQFVAAHGYTRPDDNIFASFPLGWESIVSAAMAAGMPNPRALGVWVTLADALAIAGIAGRLGANPLGRASAALSFLLIPTVCEFAPSAYVEPWLLLVTLLGLDAVLAARTTGARDLEVGVWAGLAASAKYPGLALAAGLLIALPNSRARLRAVVPLVLFGTPFYLRNLLQRGNPVFPLGWDLLGGDGWDGVRAWAYAQTLDHYGAGRDLLDHLLLVPRMFTTRELHTAFQGSIGPVILLGAWGLRRHRLILVGAIGWTIWWALTVQQVRFWLPAGALLAVGVGLMAARPARSAALLGVSLLWAWGPVGDLWRFQQTSAWWAGSVSRERLADHLLPESAPVYRDLSAYVPEDGRVWLVWMRGFTWDLPRDYRVDGVFEGWRLEAALDAGEVPTDVSHLLVNERFFLQGTSADWTSTERLSVGRTERLRTRWAGWIAEGRITEVHRWQRVVLYRVGGG